MARTLQRRHRRWWAGLILIPLSFVLAACGIGGGSTGLAGPLTTKAAKKTPTTTTLPPLKLQQTANSLAKGTTTLESAGDADFNIQLTVWSPASENPNNWTTIDPKTVNYIMHILPVPNASTEQIQIQSFQAQAKLLATSGSPFNGFVVAQSNYPPGGSAPQVSQTYPYQSNFSVDGFNSTLVGQWNTTMDLKPPRPLNEANLERYAGVYATQFSFAITLLAKGYYDSGPHPVTASFTVTVPVPNALPTAATTATQS